MKFITIIVLIFPIIVLTSCSKLNSSFVFDKVEHYRESEDNPVYEVMYQKRFENLTALENSYSEIIGRELPQKISDTSFIADLEKLNFKKSIVPLNKHYVLRAIANPNAFDEYATMACAPMYRDIYVFKNNSKVVGIAKVCFQCEVIYFINSENKWQKFGNTIEILKTAK